MQCIGEGTMAASRGRAGNRDGAAGDARHRRGGQSVVRKFLHEP